MKKIFFILLGTTILSSMMFASNITPYQYKKNTWPTPDVYSFRAYCENKSLRSVEVGALTYADSGSYPHNDGKVFVRPFRLAPNSITCFDVEWRLMNNSKSDHVYAYFILDNSKPTNGQTMNMTFSTAGDKYSKLMTVYDHTSTFHYYKLGYKTEGNSLKLTITDNFSETQHQ